MIPFFIGALPILNAFFRSGYSLGLEIFSVSSWEYSSENILVLSCESGIGYSGFFSAVIDQPGATSWLSSNLKPLWPGIGLAFVYSVPKTA